ncbi:MAG: DNA polymerase I [Candidatus Gracilibacteria bacterium]|nr:DNA polymerase I [Candidatus Gracilibacteria bacterium]
MAQYYDTLLGEYIQNPGMKGLSLDKLALKKYNYEMMSYDSMTEKGKINFKDISLNSAGKYSGEDVLLTYKLYTEQKNKDITSNKVLLDIELPTLEVIKKMEIDGVKIERNKLKGIGLLLDQEIDRLEKSIHTQAGEEFNIKSPKQVGEILFGKLALPKGKKTKTGYSVSADVLGELSHQFPIAQDIVDYRHYTKLQSTYIDGLLDIADKNDYIHTSYNAAVTTTGRLSSTKPNLQNIPSSDGIAGEIRSAFVSRFEGGKIMASDYSQVEVRLLALMSGDENLLQAFKDNKDIHHKTAEFLFPGETITSDCRKVAKAVNFGVIYGISGFGLSKMIGINMKDSKKYIDAFYESYPKVKIYFDKLISDCEENGYVETLYGRKRYIPGINDLNNIIKSAAKREAMNMPIQGTSADIIKLAMIEIAEFIKKEKLNSLMIMQVHDELVFDIYPGEEDFLSENIKKIMESILHDKEIILKSDVILGENWRETK